MKFIHTADWHLGSQLHNIERKKECEIFLQWLTSTIIENEIQALIIAGDIYDKATPSIEAQTMYHRFLASLVGTCCKNIIVVGGNHDSAHLLDANKDLLRLLNISVVGSISNLELEKACFKLFNAHDEVIGICMAVPFIREAELHNIVVDDDSDADNFYASAHKRIYDTLYRIAKKIRNDERVPIIATGHLYAANLEGRLALARSQDSHDDGMKVIDVLGNLGNIPPHIFPPVDYVALGHIHYTTMVDKNPSIRYSGSPFVMGFDDADIPHYVLCVDVKGGECPIVQKLETPSPYRYKRISGTVDEIKHKLNEMIAESVDNAEHKETFIELCYVRMYDVDIDVVLEDTLKKLPAHIKIINRKPIDQNDATKNIHDTTYSVHELKALTDKEIFTKLILTNIQCDEKSEEGKALLEKFLPLFMKVAAEIE